MRSTYNIKDAKDDLKALNDFLHEMGAEILGQKADYHKLEDLLNDDEFSKLMNNALFFKKEGFAYLAEIYEGKARYYTDRGSN